jgi:hypothetical protein
MKSIALIACSNGLGHTRRILFLANALVNKQLNVTVFAPLNDVVVLNQPDSFKRIKLVDFNSKTSTSSWVSSNSQNWYKLLPDLSEFDIVVSDNLIEILKIRHDAWLSGSFFWHESVNKFPEKLKKESQDLLLKHRPKMISSALFSSEKLKKYTSLYEVGLYSNSKKNLSLSKEFSKNDVLIACGKGGGVMSKTKDFIKRLSKLKFMIFDTVWVEPNLLPKGSPDWMKKATFTNKMYQSLIASVIRPGVGTITDSLLAHSKVFLYYESDNFEMKENSNLIEGLSLGVNSVEIDNAWSDVMDYVNNSELQREFKRKASLLNISGAQEAADIMASSLNY